MNAGFSTVPRIRGWIRRVIGAMIGRSRRYRILRILTRNRTMGDIHIGPLDVTNISAWERYLRIPEGQIKLPVTGVYTHIAVCDAMIVGHVSIFKQWVHSPIAIDGWWLTGLEVNPRWRCTGLGRRLMESVIAEWRRNHGISPLYLVVHRRNKPAIGLFASMGFRPLVHREWESRLRTAYAGSSHGIWNYRIMENVFDDEGCTDH